MIKKDGLTLVHIGADYEFYHLRDLCHRIMNDSANQIFKELFRDDRCRKKMIERYELRNGRLMSEDKSKLLQMHPQSIDNLLPTMRPRYMDLIEEYAEKK